MRRLTINHRHVLGVAVVLLLIMSMLPVSAARVISNKPRHILQGILQPALVVIRAVVGQDAMIRQGEVAESEVTRNYDQSLRINEMLRQENLELRAQIDQLTPLRQFLDLSIQSPLPATVLAWSNHRSLPTLTINRGAKHGVAVGQTVVNGVDLVGSISDVGAVTATVKLITTPGDTLYVTILPVDSDGQPREPVTELQVMDHGQVFQATVGVQAGVMVGDRVHLADDRWAGQALGYWVGQVVKVENEPDDPTLRRRVLVQPRYDFSRLRRVVVMVPTEDRGIGNGGKNR